MTITLIKECISKRTRPHCLAINVILSSLTLSPLAMTQDNVVRVVGESQESSRDRSDGQSIVVRPSDASRFDTSAHLKKESGLVNVANGRISASGFMVPRIRGQDLQFTDIFVDDMKLFDPYAGLPFLEDLDLRAFGSMEIHQGLPPVEIPSNNPVGAIRYTFRHPGPFRQALGSQIGEPLGQVLWLSSSKEWQRDAEDHSPGNDASIYVRSHQTSGKYRYYSDEGTPYNVADDRYRQRTNNDQRAWSLVPHFTYRHGPYLWESFAITQNGERGLPSQSPVIANAARQQSENYIAHSKIQRHFADFGPFASADATLAVATHQDLRQVQDESQNFLDHASASKWRLNNRRASVQLKTSTSLWESSVHVEDSSTNIRQNLDQRTASQVERKASDATLGDRWSIGESLSLSAKLSWHRQQDRDRSDRAFVPNGEEEEPTKKTRQSRGAGFGSSWAPGNGSWSIYEQWARYERLPSVMEEFGNGAGVHANDQLTSEVLWHRELGLSFRNPLGLWSTGLSIFDDLTHDKILMIPVSANASKALNLRTTRIRGAEVHGDVSWSDFGFYLSGTRQFPLDMTRSEPRILPGISQRIVAAETSYRIGPATARWLARYRSAVYRDLANQIEVPELWLHDLSLDWSHRAATQLWQLGLGISNLFNVDSLDLNAGEGANNQGRTGLSDMAGAPLPGRHWELSAALKW